MIVLAFFVCVCVRVFEVKPVPAVLININSSSSEEAAETVLRLLREYDSVCVEEAPSTRPAVILAEESPEAIVYVEGTTVASCGGLAEALLVWALAHFVFHQKTKRSTRNTNWLLRAVVLDVPHDMEPDEAVREELEGLM